MEKPASAAYSIHPLIEKRWSPRAFQDRDVEVATLRRIFEAARWAPSCFNEQPWRYIAVRRTDTDSFKRLLGCLTPNNQRWAGQAPVLVLSLASSAFAHNGKPNRHAFHDVGLASAMLTLEATAAGLGVHQMAGFDVDAARKELVVPERFDPVAVLAVGYPGDPGQLPDDLQEKERAPRQRRGQEEFVFDGVWGDPLS